MPKFLDKTIAVSGASGHLGHRVVELLLAAGARHVVALTRDPAKLASLTDTRLEVRPASFDDTPGLTAALAGVDRLLIISTDAVDAAGTRTRQHRAAVDAAKAAGVGHVVYTGLTSPYPDATNPIADSHFWTEARLAGSDIDWSVLRNNMYTDYLVPAAQQAIASGLYVHAAADGRRAFITREDCAAAATAALLDADGRRIFDIGGPEAVSGVDLAKIFAEISGRSVASQSVPVDALIAGMTGAGVPAAMAGVFARFDTDTAKGYLGIVSGHFEALVGRPPESVRSFFARNRAALAA